jgi:hypothetical protein
MPQQEPWFNENRQQLLSDLLRNSRPSALVENAATLGTGLVAQAGTGLGVGAGMAAQALRGQKPDLGAATEAIEEGAGKFSYQPRTEGGQELQRGLGEVLTPIDAGMQKVGQVAADVTGSPAVGAGVYTALNVLDPELLAPAAAKAAALRGASNIARRGAETAVPMSEALRNVPKGQRGAYSLEDLSAVEGNFEFQSPTLEAFGRLKKQEQRIPGKQMLKALQREGAKPDELKWAGLDKLLNTDEVVSADEVRAIAEGNVPQIGFETKGGRPEPVPVPAGAKPPPQWPNPYEGQTTLEQAMGDNSQLEDDVNEIISNRVSEDDDLEYPETYTVYSGRGRGRDTLESFDNERDAERYVEQHKDDQIESETDYYLENIGEHIDEDALAEMTDEQKQTWAEEAARTSVEDSNELTIESETDYDAGATNEDSLREYWTEQVHDNPEDYGIDPADYELEGFAPPERRQRRERRRWYQNQGIDPDTMEPSQSWQQATPSYGEYTVGGSRSEGSGVLGGVGKNYGVTLANVLREGRYGRGQDIAQISSDLSTTGTPLSVREALRITNREELPDIEAARGEFSGRGTHFGENILHTRETDRPAPEWGTTQVDAYGQPDPMRMVEEIQSDPYQRGRKIGFVDPEKIKELKTNEAARVEAFQREAIAGLPLALREPQFDELIQKARAEAGEAGGSAGGSSMLTALDHWQQMQAEHAPLEIQLEAASDFWRNLYLEAPEGSPAEARASEIRASLNNLPSMDSTPFDKMIPEGPFMDTDQYTALGVREALMRGIRQGQQYFGFTPGEVHARRYGSESLQWGPGDKPSERRLTALDYGGTGKGPINERVRQLSTAGPHDSMSNSLPILDLDSPDAAQQMKGIVASNLDYGMHEYPDPDVQRTKRAEALIAKLRKEPSGEYTPREFGFSDVYDRRVKKQLQAALREAGSKAAIRDVPGQFGVPTFERVHPDGTRTFETSTSKDEFEALLKDSQENPDTLIYHPPVIYAIEADPALAQHAKRGFKYPH